MTLGDFLVLGYALIGDVAALVFFVSIAETSVPASKRLTPSVAEILICIVLGIFWPLVFTFMVVGWLLSR